MPAITVDDLTVLDRVREPGLGDQPRPVWSVSTAPSGFEGEGFPVRRAFAGIDLAHLDPFIMMDQMGEVEYAPGEPKGTPWHPHRGFETVTYIIDGTFDHQDSHGGGGTITNGDTQWMTAGSGILHIEAPPEWLVEKGGLFHGIQLWVNLPARRQAQRPEIPGHPLRPGRAADLRRRGRAGPGHRRDGRRPRGPRLDIHADDPGARDHRARRTTRPAVGRRLQRARLRAQRHGSVGVDAQPIQIGQAAALGAGDYVTIAADKAPGRPVAEARRDRGRRTADPRASRLGRAIRDELKGRGDAGLRRLPARKVRAHPGLTGPSVRVT